MTKTTHNVVGHYIAAPWRSSGKSMVSMGLARIAARRSFGVQTFKKGPDYIDPLWLKAASLNSCYNLDPYLQNPNEINHLFQQHINDVVLTEGTMGLHDGLATDGSDSNAAIATQLGLPVLLVVDCRGMHRSTAALLNGLTQFDPKVRFSGVILNRLKSDRHASKIENAINEYCDLNVLGAIHECQSLSIDERELGLLPAPDHPEANSHIDNVADALQATCDIDRLFEKNMKTEVKLAAKHDTPTTSRPMTVGIARDEAFHFYYEDDLETLRSRGVQLVEFSPIRDPLPHNLDGLLLGGGFPERHAAALASNHTCAKAIAKAISGGLPVRAECGGLMYLCQSMEIDNVAWPMVGAIDGVVSMHNKPQGRGYVRLKVNQYLTNTEYPDTLYGHEFHHSKIHFDEAQSYLYQIERGFGIDGQSDGVCVNNVIASYAHLRHTEKTPWVDWFLESISDRLSALDDIRWDPREVLYGSRAHRQIKHANKMY